MGLAERADLVARLSLKDDFSKGLAGVKRSLGGTVAQIAKGTALGNLADRAISSGIRAFTGALRAGDASLQELEAVGLRTNAVIKSTAGVAGQTTESIRKLAESYEDLTTNDDKAIQNTENLLLTFTNLRGEGFEPALKAVLDMNAAMGGGDEGLQGTAIKVGKALQDPIKGLTALSRVGVAFTADQTKLIKGLTTFGSTLGAVDKLGIKLTATQRAQLTAIDGTTSAAILLDKAGIKLTKGQVKQIDETARANGVFEAQKLILAELNKEFGGQAEAFGEGRAGDVRRLGDAVEDFQRTLAEGLAPAVDSARKGLTQLLKDPEVLQAVKDLSAGISGLFTPEGIQGGISGVKSVIAGLKEVPWGVIGTSLKIGGAGAKVLFDAFNTMPDWVKTAVLTGWGLNKVTGGLVGQLASGLIKGVLGMNAGIVNIKAAVVNGAGGAPGAAAGAGLIPTLIGSAGVGGVVVLGAQSAGVIADGWSKGYDASQKGDFQGMLDAQKSLATNLEVIPGPIRDFLKGIYDNGQTQLNEILQPPRSTPMSPDERQAFNDLTAATKSGSPDERQEAADLLAAVGEIADNTKMSKQQRLAALEFPFRIKHRVRSVDDLPDIGDPYRPKKHPERLGDPFGFRHLKSFSMGQVDGKMGPELTKAIRDVETQIRVAQEKGQPGTVAKLQDTKEGLETLLQQVKNKTFEAGKQTYQALLLQIDATNKAAGAVAAPITDAIDRIPAPKTNVTVKVSTSTSITTDSISRTTHTSATYNPNTMGPGHPM